MVAFRRRFPAGVMAEINEAIIQRQSKEDDSSAPKCKGFIQILAFSLHLYTGYYLLIV
jgi:hypothetical protein